MCNSLSDALIVTLNDEPYIIEITWLSGKRVQISFSLLRLLLLEHCEYKADITLYNIYLGCSGDK